MAYDLALSVSRPAAGFAPAESPGVITGLLPTGAEVAAGIAATIERGRLTSAGALRLDIYGWLAAHGIDPVPLIAAAHEQITAEITAECDRLQANRAAIRARIDRGDLAPDRLRAAELRLAKADVREKSGRKLLADTVRRLEGRQAPPQAHAAPTAERLRHFGEAAVVRERDEHDQPLAGRRYELRWAVDRLGMELSAEAYNGAMRLRETYWAQTATAKVVDLNGSGGGSSGARAPATDRQLAARGAWRAIYGNLPGEARTVALNFICEVPPAGKSEPLTALEFGRLHSGVKDPMAARGDVRGALRVTCDLVALLWRIMDGTRAERRAAERRAAGDPAPQWVRDAVWWEG